MLKKGVNLCKGGCEELLVSLKDGSEFLKPLNFVLGKPRLGEIKQHFQDTIISAKLLTL
jgi:hypothetical protein